MSLQLHQDNPEIWSELERFDFTNKVIVSPTDTVFGFACRATDSETRDKILKLKGGPKRPLITLVSDISQVEQLAALNGEHRTTLEKHWPGAITFILNGPNETVSFRLPDNAFLLKLLKITGPLVSTSCNRHGESTVTSAKEAQTIFGDAVDLYIDGPALQGSPSTIVNLSNGDPAVLRLGSVQFTGRNG